MCWLSKLLDVTSGILLSENRALYLDCIKSSIHVSRVFWLTKLFNLWLQVFMRRGLPIIPGEVPKDIALLQFLIIRLCFPVIKISVVVWLLFSVFQEEKNKISYSNWTRFWLVRGYSVDNLFGSQSHQCIWILTSRCPVHFLWISHNLEWIVY